MQVLHQPRPGGTQRQRPGIRVAVRVAGVAEDVAERDAVFRHRSQDRDQGADGVYRRQEHRVMRRVSSGTSGPFSSRSMVPAEK